MTRLLNSRLLPFWVVVVLVAEGDGGNLSLNLSLGAMRDQCLEVDGGELSPGVVGQAVLGLSDLDGVANLRKAPPSVSGRLWRKKKDRFCYLLPFFQKMTCSTWSRT